MKILKFVGASNREVLDQVRQLLGPDALIISNRRLEDAQIEVMAADPRSISADFDPVAVPKPSVTAQTSAQTQAQVQTPASAAPLTAAPVPAAPDFAQPEVRRGAERSTQHQSDSPPGADRLPRIPVPTAGRPGHDGQPSEAASQPQRDAAATPGNAPVSELLANLQGEMSQRLDGLIWGKALQESSAKAGLFRELLAAGFSATLARELLEQVPDGEDAHALRLRLRTALISRLVTVPAGQELLAGAGIYALVGPTGVGKTTTIAKLAARCVALHGRGSLALVTADSYRIAAQEQLQTFGRMMGVPVYPLRADADLKSLLARLSDKRIVLVDNMGLSQRDRKVASQLALLHQEGMRVRRLLVLNAAGQGDTLEEVVQAYAAGAAMAGCIITKLDEASRSGTVLDAAIRHGLAVHYVAHGQKVPEDLSLPSAESLVDGALHPAGGSSGLYAPDAAGLAALLHHADVQARERTGQGEAALGQWLPWLLHSQQAGEEGSAAAAFVSGAAWMRADPASRLAFDAWKTWVAAGQASAGKACLPAHALASAWARAAGDAVVTACDRVLLAVHGQAALDPELPRTILEGVLLASDRGHMLAAPAPVLAGPFGRLGVPQTPAGAAQENRQAALSPAESMASRAQGMAWLDGELSQARAVHMLDPFDGAPWTPGQAPAHGLPAGSFWMAACPPDVRLIAAGEEQPVMATALADSLASLPLPLAMSPGWDEMAVGWWGAGVALAGLDREASDRRCLESAREAPPAGMAAGSLSGLRLLVLRHVDGEAEGRPGVQMMLSNVPASLADNARLAAWWLYAQRMRRAFGLMSQAWKGLGRAVNMAVGDEASAAGQQSRLTETMRMRALLAGQMGALGWQAIHAGHAEPLRRALKAAAGWDREDSAWQTMDALWRLFALQAMNTGLSASLSASPGLQA